MTKKPGLTIAVIAALLTIALAGCASSGSGGSGSGSSPSATDDGDDATSPKAAWLNNGASLALVTWGSSSAACTPSAADVKANGQTVTVKLANPQENAMCTMDFVPRGTYVALPDGVDPTKDVTVAYQGKEFNGSVTLPGNSALTGQDADGKSTAGWYEPGGIVLLTWGSSSCPPVVENIADDAKGATVNFQAPNPAQACTADFAPRLTLLGVTPPATTTGYTLGLVGNNLDGVVAVIG